MVFRPEIFLSATPTELDPYREAAWRLQMRLASAVGDEDRVIGAFRGCERALAELGARPAGATRHLLDALRR